jgi:HSP20 family protein
MTPALRNGSHPVNRLFDRLFQEEFFTPVRAATWTAVPLAVWEDEQHVYVEADVPGIAEQDLELSVHDEQLTLRGERKCEHPGTGDPRRYGQFEQQLHLPKTVDPSQVEAKLTNGVLRITIGKRAESRPRKISVTAK